MATAQVTIRGPFGFSDMLVGMRRYAAVVVVGMLAAALAVPSCGSPTPKAQGESCVASSECDVGLVCDFGQEPHVCAGMGTPPGIDAAEPEPDAPAEPIDGPTPQPDAPTPDAAEPDAPPPDAPEVDAPEVDAA